MARISGVPSYILLLYIISEQKRLKLKDDSIKAIVDLLINFFVRRNVTDVPSTRKIPQLFMDIIAEIKDMTGKTIINSIRKHLKDVSATDTAFEKALRGPIYDDNPEATRFLLCGIEAKHQTKEIYSDLWKRDGSNKYIWTIEHVFPEGEKIPEAWVKMIADGDRELANMYREKYVHTLGNLTITGYNQSLSNMPFEKKRDRKVKNKDVGYRNGLFLNKNIIKAKTWTIDKIESRTNRIILILMDMYSWK